MLISCGEAQLIAVPVMRAKHTAASKADVVSDGMLPRG
jgi:hypothetical protein